MTCPPPMIIVVTRGRRDSRTAIFVETFAPPMMATNGFAGFSKTPPRNLISFSMRKPATPGRIFAMPSVEACARCAVPNASLTYTSPREASLLANVGIVLLLLRVEAHVLQEHHVARLHGLHHGLRLGPDAVRREGHLAAQQLRQPLRDRREAVFLVRLLRPSEVAHEDEGGTLLVQDVVQRRQRGGDARVIRDLPFLQGHIEVHPDEDALLPQIDVANGLLGHTHAPCTGSNRHSFQRGGFGRNRRKI